MEKEKKKKTLSAVFLVIQKALELDIKSEESKLKEILSFLSKSIYFEK